MKLLTSLTLLLLLLVTRAGIAVSNDEIGYLLSFVADSNCTFIRNGKNYSGVKAAEHLEYKYSRFKTRITTAELFVEKIASKSSFSNKPYEVQCDTTIKSTHQWLFEALDAFRKQEKSHNITGG